MDATSRAVSERRKEMKDNELITRKNIELALLNKGQHSRRYKLGNIWELNYDEIREVLNGVNADVQPIRWIPCSERLPKLNSRCVLLYGNDNISGGYYRGNKTFDVDYEDKDVNTMVIAWMPSPVPY